MILAIDIGNTRIKWGLHDGRGWRGCGSVALADVQRFDWEIPPGAIERAVIANVAGEAAARAVASALGQRAGELVWVRPAATQCGVRNGYEDPAQLGSDRWAALIGAHHLHPESCLVVMAGTATTVDVLDATGMFRGGLILPGIGLMRRSLAQGTARLGLQAGMVADLPRNTADAITSGCMQAHLGAIERQFARIAAEPGALCILSGGASASLHERLDLPRRRVDGLVLEGLIRIACERT